MLQTITKIGPLLDLFTADCADWGVAEVAAALDIPRSSAHAMLSSLVATGLLRTRGRGRYRVGWRVLELGEALGGRADLRAAARPVLRGLAARCGETAHLAVCDRAGGIYVDRVLGHHPASVTGPRVGSRFPLRGCAAGRVMLACSDHAADHSADAALNAELARVRMTGCATDAGEAVPDVHSVAAPISDEDGAFVAALTVMAPPSRFLPRLPALKRAVVGAAAQVSRALAG